jgi:hypothetical protein
MWYDVLRGSEFLKGSFPQINTKTGGDMERHRTVTIEGWKYYLVFGIAFVICLFAVFGLIMLCWVGYEIWPRIAGTGEHEVKMIWRGGR